MQYPASQADHTSIIPGHLIHTIIRPALLLILLLFSSFSALAYDCKVDNIYYNLNNDDKTASVTNTTNNKYVGNIIIPESITYSGTTYSVTSIGDNAFRRSLWLTSVTIPNSVTSIGYGAFSRCSGLTSVTIPNSVTFIGESAFAYCSGLTSVTIGNSVISIGGYAFDNCTGLTSVTIPNSVTTIGYGAFNNCTGLTSVTIPNSVTTIGYGAFYGCSGLTSVAFNAEKCTKMEDYVFSGCTSLTSLTIGDKVTTIPNFAFACFSGLTSVTVDKNNGTYDSRNNCNAIIETSTNNLIFGCKNTTIPNSVTSIGDRAFYGCSELTSVTIPNSVTTIGHFAFYNCSGLTSVTIPNSVTSIGGIAFSGCSGLTSVTIPNSVTSIGSYAFHGCSGLTSVTVDKNNGTYDSRNNCNAIIETSTNNLIFGCKNTTIPNSVTSIGDQAFYGCSELTSVTIPNSVTFIGNFAFSGCSGLTSVTIPNSVTTIGSYAFHGCSGLTSVTIPNSVTFIGKYAFQSCSGLTKMVSLAVEPPTCGEGVFEKVDKTTCQLLVPEESINKYKTADQWKEFLNILGYDGVDDVSVDSPDAVYEVYNLQGVRVGSGMREEEVTADVLPHGVYILVSPQGRKKLKI